MHKITLNLKKKIQKKSFCQNETFTFGNLLYIYINIKKMHSTINTNLKWTNSYFKTIWIKQYTVYIKKRQLFSTCFSINQTHEPHILPLKSLVAQRHEMDWKVHHRFNSFKNESVNAECPTASVHIFS